MLYGSAVLRYSGVDSTRGGHMCVFIFSVLPLTLSLVCSAVRFPLSPLDTFQVRNLLLRAPSSSPTSVGVCSGV